MLRADGVLTPTALSAALALASGAVIVEAILLRGLIGLGQSLGLPSERLGAIAALAIFSFALLLLEIPLTRGLLGCGRRLELRLRLAFLRKIPRLPDRYFQSRLKSDMAERSHSIHLIRRLPELGGQLLRYIFEIFFTTAGIIWLDPASAPIAVCAALAAVVIPLASQPLLMERDLRLRTHSGALTRFYLDALLGLVAIHTHGAQPAVRREHESLLTEWARAGLNLQRAVISLETIQFLAGFGLAIWLLASHLARPGASGTALLLVYWALNLPALGQEVALMAWQYPSYRNTTLRLLEPLGAIEQRTSHASSELPPARCRGLHCFRERIGHRRRPHHTPRHHYLDRARRARRQSLAHREPASPAWSVFCLAGTDQRRAAFSSMALNSTKPPLNNYAPTSPGSTRPCKSGTGHYSKISSTACQTARAYRSMRRSTAAELQRVLEQLPEGLKTPLGEGGGLVSGGEGQRVRLARALLRPGVRLVILDEPFRGLDFEQRRVLLARAREIWRDATLLSISHDIAETMTFERVLVIEEGRIVEDGDPRELAQNPESRLHAMLRAEQMVREELWAGSEWRRLQLENGVLIES